MWVCMHACKKDKCMFLYSAISSPSDRSKRFTLHPLADLFIQFAFSGKNSDTHKLLPEDYLLTFAQMSTARYSFIQLSEMGHCGENENAQASKR